MDEDLRKIRVAGTMFIVLGVLGLYVFASAFLEPSAEAYLFGPTPPPLLAIGFWLVSVALPVAVGVGLLRLWRWAYYLATGLLYLMLPGFPIGTAIGWTGLRWLRRTGVKRRFGIAI